MVGNLLNDVTRFSIIFERVVENVINQCFRFICYMIWLKDENEKTGTHCTVKIERFMIAITF